MRYSDEDRHAALDCLAANEGDFRRTSEETGIGLGTLRKWAREEQASWETVWEMRKQLAAFQKYRKRNDANDVRQEMFDTLLVNMTHDSIRLSESIEETIADAPLNQRATALNQIIDKVIKLMEMLPPVEEQVIRVEFIDSDGSAHETPYWSRGDSEE